MINFIATDHILYETSCKLSDGEPDCLTYQKFHIPSTLDKGTQLNLILTEHLILVAG